MDLPSLLIYVSLFTTLFFEVFILITYLEAREELRFEKEYAGKNLKRFPTVTIIVPCFNEEETLNTTVKSILNLDYPKDRLRVIIVDDGSVDGTAREMNRFKHHLQVRLLSKENGGKHTALNFALESVNTELVGCLDADSFAKPDALKKLVYYFQDEKIMAVTPSIRVHEPKSFLQHIQKVEYNWGIFLRRMLSALGALYVTPGPLSIFRTRVFKELGGYRLAHQTEDLEMALRLQKNRYKIVNSLGAHVYTVTPSNLKSLVKQRVRWSYGFLNNAIDYREMFFNRKYGHVGLFILPLGTISIFSTLAIISNALVNFLIIIFNTFERLRFEGFSSSLSWPSFDWYFLNTGSLSLITLVAVILSLLIVGLSLNLAEGRIKISKGLLYYIFFYSLIAPLWLVKAVFDTIFGRKVSWR